MGEWQDKAEGKAREAVGNATGDDDQQAKGQAQQAKGGVEGAANDAKDAANNVKDAVTNNS